MQQKFEIVFLDEAYEFLKKLDKKDYRKILYNITKAQRENDPKLFKKLVDEIWEFRTKYQGKQYRLLAFWDKTTNQNTLVVSTHGFVKKQSKISGKEIKKAERIRQAYFKNKKTKEQ